MAKRWCYSWCATRLRRDPSCHLSKEKKRRKTVHRVGVERTCFVAPIWYISCIMAQCCVWMFWSKITLIKDNKWSIILCEKNSLDINLKNSMVIYFYWSENIFGQQNLMTADFFKNISRIVVTNQLTSARYSHFGLWECLIIFLGNLHQISVEFFVEL